MHQDRRAAGAHLHRPAWPEGSVQGAAGCRAVEAAADLRLGSGDVDRGAAHLCGVGCTVSACAVGTAGGAVDPRGAVGSGGGLLCVPARPRPVGSAGLRGSGYLPPLTALVRANQTRVPSDLPLGPSPRDLAMVAIMPTCAA